jgi:hypothetical protein
MDISITARVNCSDGPCGQITRVLLKPSTEEITDLVVVSNEAFPETEYQVPIIQVVESTPGQVRLRCSSQELAKMPVFDRVVYGPSFTGYIGSPFMLAPYYFPARSGVDLAKEHIPDDELAIRRGAGVDAIDGHVGCVDEFLIDPGNDRITHLVMREGHLWGRKDVTIPVDRIDYYKDNTVFLKLNKQEIEKLPGLPVRHSQAKQD